MPRPTRSTGLARPDPRRARPAARSGAWSRSSRAAGGWPTPTTSRAPPCPLADRVEWAVFSLLSTAGPISETAFYDRIASLFSGHDLPDDGLVRACLESYRSLASTPDGSLTTDDLLRRSQEHTELLATIADAGHRLGMRVWIGRREQTRRVGEGSLGDLLDDGEQRAYLGGISPAAEELAEVDVHLVRPRQGRASCSRSSGPRCSASRSCAGTPGSRPTTR